jgi:hypothetical protein
VVTTLMTSTVCACCGVTPDARWPLITADAWTMRGSNGGGTVDVVVVVSGTVVSVTIDVVVSTGIAFVLVVVGIVVLVGV